MASDDTPPPALRYDYDFILERYVGRPGRWHVRQFLLLMLVKFAKTVPYFIHLFTAYRPAHRCRVDSCEGDGGHAHSATNYHAPWTEFAVPPGEADGAGMLRQADTIRACEMYLPLSGLNVTLSEWNATYTPTSPCHASHFSQDVVVPCPSGHVFDTSVFSETVATKFDLVCDRAYMTNLIDQSLVLGTGVGALLGVFLGDRLGRRLTMLAGMASLSLSTLAMALAGSAETYLGLRFLQSIFIFVCAIPNSSTVMELCSPKYRTKVFALSTSFETLFMTLLGVFSYLERDWRLLHLWIGLPSLGFTVVLYAGLAESVRWLVVNGKEAEAGEAVWKIAEENGRRLGEEDREEIGHILGVIAARSAETRQDKRSVLTIFNRTYLARTACATLAWTSINWTYFAMALNNTDLSGDVFLNYIFTWSLDVPVNLYLMYALDKAGRKPTLVVCLAATALACGAMAFVPKHLTWPLMSVYQSGRMAASVANYVMLAYVNELYPTTLRVRAVASVYALARCLGSLASFVGLLDAALEWPGAAMLALAGPAGAAAVLAALGLPETNGRDLPENDRDVRGDRRCRGEDVSSGEKC